MNRYCKGLAAAALVALGAGAAAAEAVKVGLSPEPYPPFSVPDAAGNWTGWEIEIMQAICREADLECEITPTAWDGIIPALNSGRIDMIFNSMSITEARSEVIDFSEPYYRGSTLVAGPEGMDLQPTPEGLAGKVLGVQGSTIHERYANKHFTDSDIKVYPTQEEAFQDLISGRIDATQADALAVNAFLESPAGQECCESKGAVERDEAVLGRGVGAGLRKDDDELREKVNEAILAIRESGEYQKITSRYFDFDIYGE
jgi:polar amino acid transport system substrate-binding protein